MLWPRAAAALGGMPVPPGWGATGLADSDYPPMAAAIAALLGVALGIQAIALMGEAAPEGAIRTILGRTAPRGGPALSAVVAVLLARLPGSGRIVSLATEAAGGSPPRSVDAAVDHVLDSLQAAVDGGSAIGAGLAQATADTAHIVGMLSEVEFSAATRPDRKRRIERARHGAGQLCLERFAAAARQEFTARLDALAAIPDDPAMLALEAGARGLRRLEAAGRRLGGGEAYDATLRACLSRLQESSGVLGLGDRVRLVEILMGTEQALLALSQVNGGTGLPP